MLRATFQIYYVNLKKLPDTRPSLDERKMRDYF